MEGRTVYNNTLENYSPLESPFASSSSNTFITGDLKSPSFDI